ncbi:hypothetical protein [Trinickia symbiotica]|nr:hypothetical protein [Trinickia symbiotica]
MRSAQRTLYYIRSIKVPRYRSMFPLPLTDKLTNMLNAKYVRPTIFKASNAAQFRRNAASFLQSAKDAKQPPIVRYALAYEAVHALAIGFLYLHALAPTGGDGHRIRAIGTLLDHVGLELDIDDRIEIEHAARESNDKIYESPAPPPSARQAIDLIESVVRVEGLVKRLVPTWYSLEVGNS